MKGKQPSLIELVAAYYAERAPVYDETAGYTEAEAEVLRAPSKERYRKLFAGHDVLEVASGSGYWTEVVGEVATSVLATDVNQAMIDLARRRCRHLPNVTFSVSDAFTLQGISGRFTAAFGIWWWSHIPKGELETFLKALHNKLVPGSLVLFTDQLPYDGVGRRVDDEGNIIESRSLPDGRTFEVVKNFPTASEIAYVLGGIAENIAYVAYSAEKHWTVTYTTARPI